MKAKVFLIPIIVIACILMASCGVLDAHLSKDTIISFVKGNQELLNKVPEEIKSLGVPSCFISTTGKIPIENRISPDNTVENSDFNDMKGLYLEIDKEDGSNSFMSLQNDVFSKILDIYGIMGIGCDLSNDRFFIDLHYGGEDFGSQMSYWGFYYVEDGLPIGWAGEDVPFTKSGNGWSWREAEDSDNIYYTEKITGRWFYYQMDW